MDKKTRPIYMLPPRDPSQIERYTQTKSKGLEKDISCKWKGKKTGVAILISGRVDFKTKAILRDKGGHYIVIKRTTQHEDITLVNIYPPKRRASKYINEISMDIKGEIDSNTVIVRDFTPYCL